MSSKQKRITIKKVPHQGIQIEAEIGEDTSPEEIIQLLRELGYNQEVPERDHISLQQLINKIFQNYMDITRIEGGVIGQKLYTKWKQIGFDIVDLQALLDDREAKANAKKVLQETELHSIEDVLVPPVEDPPEVGLFLPEPAPEYDNYPEETVVTPPVEVLEIPDEEQVLVNYAIDEDPELDEIPDENPPDECEYCNKFRNVGTMVCPHCGRPLTSMLKY